MRSRPESTYLKRIERRILILLVALCGVSAVTGTVQAQVDPYFYDFPNNHLKWYTIESDHFLIHFQDGNSRSAQVVSRVAEEVYGPITGLYNYEPEGKTSIVLKDREDYSNGAAYFFDNKIDIWVPPLDTPLRGTHNWFRNVITHEFTHIVQIRAAMKRNRSIPAIYFQWLSYEKVRRPDVLYGYPNGIVTFPFASVSVPAWFAEGTAQYQRTGWNFDTWDSHRDMILRTRILNDKQLGFVDMGTFASKTSLERETVYNQGFAFTIYIARRFGEDMLRKITEALSQNGVNDMNKAIEMATGIPGQQLFDEWVADRRDFYQKATEGLDYTPSQTVESKGFYNFHPEFLPDGNLAWLSNKGRDYSRVSLYVKAMNDSTGSSPTSLLDLSHPTGRGHSAMSCGNHETPLVHFIETPFSFSDDGKWLVYSKTKLNKLGELYRDLYLYDREKRETVKALTENERAEAPAFSPDGNRIAATTMRDATINLVIFDREADSLRQLTHYSDGEIVFTPTWSADGSSIYFAYADKGPRSIRRYNLETGRAETVLEGPHTDYRDPEVGPDGLYLYYSANPDGIFNIYRKNLQSGREQKLTSVLGGAFMPAVSNDGKLAYSEYQADGYKLHTASLDTLLAQNPRDRYERPKVEVAAGTIPDDKDRFDDILQYNDDDIDAIPAGAYTQADTNSYGFELQTDGSSDDRSFYSYRETTTNFNFYPVIRFDNYSKLNGSNASLLKNGSIGKLGENLARDFKAGIYFASREVTERLDIFGGAVFGWGSRPTDGPSDFFRPGRLVDLDRDLFFTVEYEGLPFIDRYWSPTVSVELYNMHRNVEDGLSIEEFPCTSCLPDTTSTDIAYEIWEADLFLRSKLSKYSLVELGLAYSPYRVSTEGFVSRELKQYVPGSTSQYFKGTRLMAAYVFDGYEFYRNSDIAPIGFKGFLQYTYNPSKLLDEYEINDGTLSPVYESFKNHTIEAKGRFGFRLNGRKTGQVYSRVYSNLNNPDDYFFLDYIGGFTGLRSYPYFAVGGNTTAFTEFSYFTPIWTNINEQFGQFTLDKVYTRFFLEAGKSWRGPLDTGDQIKTGAGAELRFSLNSYYLFPLRVFVSGAYGFNKYSMELPDEFITGSQDNRVNYGREWMFHFGLTFDFEVLYDRFRNF